MSDNDPADDSFFDVAGLPGEEEDTSDTLVGTVLDGRFRLESVLGEGGMGKVYAGTQLSVGREVAIKLLRSEALVQHEVKERFLREAKLISGFNHPNIVRLIDYGEDAERKFPYLVMELVGGISLGELTRRGRLAVPLALEICDQVCAALIQAHAAGIVHRDLKPENLKLLPVVGDSFQVKVLDFGIAFPRDANSRLTSTGMICGTSYYIAPEQARAWELDGRADLYALGIILFEMLSGHLPFRGDSDFQILLKQVQQPPPALSNYLAPDEVPTPVIELVHELLEKDPEARPESAREVRERIAQLRRDCDIPALDLDLEEASVEAFDRWLLPRDEDSALAEASTAFDAATPAEALEQLVNDTDISQPHPTKTEHADVQKSDSSQTELESGPADVDGNSTQTDANQPNQRPPTRRGRWIALAAAVLLLVGAWGAWANYGHILQGSGGGGGGEAAGDEDGDPPGSDGAGESAATAPIALDAFAGGCRILGESGAWFHTVFLHPEVGEVLLWGDAQIVWSPVELGERDGRNLNFSYEHPDRDEPQKVRVRASGDKLVIRTDDNPKFVCRLDPEPRYFDTLATVGPFSRDVDDEQSKDREATLEVAETGQRLEADGVSFVYRILSGRELTGGVRLAVREAEDREAGWSLWQLEFDDDEGELVVERGDRTTRYLTRARRLADRKASEKPRQNAKKSAKTRKRPTPTPPTPAIPEPATPAPGKSGESDKSASSEEVAHYRKKVEALANRCADLISKMKANIARLEKLQEEERYDELEEFSQTMQVEQKRYNNRLRATTKEYSQLMTEITLSDFDRAQMVGLSSIYTNKCTWE